MGIAPSYASSLARRRYRARGINLALGTAVATALAIFAFVGCYVAGYSAGSADTRESYGGSR